MRVCHLDTCPVGIATQNPELRARFSGSPEFVETFFEYIAEEVREHLAALGFRSIEEAVGQIQLPRHRQGDHATGRPPASTSAPILAEVQSPDGSGTRHTVGQDHGLEKALDHQLIAAARDAIDHGSRGDRAVRRSATSTAPSARCSATRSPRCTRRGSPTAPSTSPLTGSAGQSFGAFLPGRHHAAARGRRQRLRRQGALRRPRRRAPGPGLGARRRGERHRRQRHRLRRDLRRAVPARPRRRAVLRAQLRRHRGRRGRGRPRPRVHDRRHRAHPRPDRAQRRGRDVRWRRLRPRPRPAPRQPRARRPRRRCGPRTSSSSATSSSATSAWTDSPVAARLLADWDTARSAFTLVLPRAYQRVLDVRSKAAAEGLDPDGAQVWERIMEASRG